METNKVPKKLINRLPVYLHYLKSLPDDVEHISATTMANGLGLGDVQVRKDLAQVSHAGRRRTGRSREELIRDIERYLHFVTEIGTVIVGTGKLGQALLDYHGFREFGLNIMAGFDILPAETQSETGKPIYHINRLDTFCKHHDVHIGIITVPPESAQSVCDRLVSCGIKAIWNFAPVHLTAPDHVMIHSENLAVSLSALRIHMRNQLREK